jgi:hypothetical protein
VAGDIRANTIQHFIVSLDNQHGIGKECFLITAKDTVERGLDDFARNIPNTFKNALLGILDANNATNAATRNLSNVTRR